MEFSLITVLPAKCNQCSNVHMCMYVITVLLCCKDGLILCSCFDEVHSRDAIVTNADSNSGNQVRLLLKASFSKY